MIQHPGEHTPLITSGVTLADDVGGNLPDTCRRHLLAGKAGFQAGVHLGEQTQKGGFPGPRPVGVQNRHSLRQTRLAQHSAEILKQHRILAGEQHPAATLRIGSESGRQQRRASMLYGTKHHSAHPLRWSRGFDAVVGSYAFAGVVAGCGVLTAPPGGDLCHPPPCLGIPSQ